MRNRTRSPEGRSCGSAFRVLARQRFVCSTRLAARLPKSFRSNGWRLAATPWSSTETSYGLGTYLVELMLGQQRVVEKMVVVR